MNGPQKQSSRALSSLLVPVAQSAGRTLAELAGRLAGWPCVYPGASLALAPSASVSSSEATCHAKQWEDRPLRVLACVAVCVCVCVSHPQEQSPKRVTESVATVNGVSGVGCAGSGSLLCSCATRAPNGRGPRNPKFPLYR